MALFQFNLTTTNKKPTLLFDTKPTFSFSSQSNQIPINNTYTPTTPTFTAPPLAPQIQSGPIQPRGVIEETPQEIAFNTITGLPSAALQVGKEIAQSTARSAAAVGQGVLNVATLGKAGSATPAPRPGIEQAIFGTDQPISLQSVGEEYPFVPQGSPIAPFLAVGGFTLDWFPGGKSAKTLVTSLIETGSIKKAESILIKAGIPEQTAKTYAPQFAGATTKKEVETLLKKIAGPSATSVQLDQSLRIQSQLEELTSADFIGSDGKIRMDLFQEWERLKTGFEKGVATHEDTREASELLALLGRTSEQITGIKEVPLVQPRDKPTGQYRPYNRGFFKLPFIGNKTTPELPARTAKLPSVPEAPAPTRALPALQKIPSLVDDITNLKTNTDLNVDNLNISKASRDIIKDTVDDMRPVIEARVGTKLTNKQVLEFADNTSRLLTKTVGKEQTLVWEGAMLKARQEIAFAAKTGVVDRHFIDTLLAVKTHGTDVARKLQSLSIGADPKEATAMQTILSAVLDANKNVDEIARAANDIDFNDMRQAALFYRQFIKPKASEWLDLLRYNSMLSSPKTHIVNAASNALNSVLIAPLEHALSGGMDFLGSTITGADRKLFAGEAGAYLKAYLLSVKTAFDKFADIMSGKAAMTNLDTKAIPLAPEGGVKGALEKTLGFPMRLLEGMDQFFTTLTKEGELARLNYRASKGVKVNTNEIAKASERAAYRLYRQDLFPEGQGTLLNAVDELTSIIYRARTSDNPIVAYPAKFSIPFIKTPMNIFKQGIEYSPTGWLTLIGSADKNPQIAKAIIGSSVFAAGGLLLASNRLSWAEPTDETSKNAFRAAGMQAYSVKIGDEWVAYQKLPPALAFPLSMIALLHQAQEERKLDESTMEVILSSIAKYGEFLADQSYAKSFGDLLAAINGGESAWARVASNYPQQLIPFRAFSGWLARLVDHIQRKPDPEGTFIEKEVQYLMMNIPGLSTQVPARKDTTGEDVEHPSPYLNAFTPFNTSTENPEKAAEYQDIKSLKRTLSDQSTKSSILGDQAHAEYARLSAMSKEDAAVAFDELFASNPTLANKVADLVKSEAKGLTPKDQLILRLHIDNGERAKYLAEQFNQLDTKEEKAAYWDELTEKKILTKKVIEQLVPLLQ